MFRLSAAYGSIHENFPVDFPLPVGYVLATVILFHSPVLECKVRLLSLNVYNTGKCRQPVKVKSNERQEDCKFKDNLGI